VEEEAFLISSAHLKGATLLFTVFPKVYLSMKLNDIACIKQIERIKSWRQIEKIFQVHFYIYRLLATPSRMKRDEIGKGREL